MDKAVKVLQHYFGYTDFRPDQKDIVQQVLNKKNSLCILPTGGGKSICFQVPILACEGMGLVISPLIALIEEQVNQLRKLKINAYSITSQLNSFQIEQVLQYAQQGKVKFLYIAPERLTSDLFQRFLPKLKINYMVIDEAHCISQWGHDFRPAYQNITSVIKDYPSFTRIAFTATASKDSVIDITNQLKIPKENVFQKSLVRSNLSFQIRDSIHPYSSLLEELKSQDSQTAIVYVRTRKKTTQIADYLSKNGVPALPYHAGLKVEEKNINNHRWKTDQVKLMIATTAFGMGIDKANVRAIYHIDTPECIENYIQEVGRAGRDGEQAKGVLWINPKTVSKEEDKLLSRQLNETNCIKTYKWICHQLQLSPTELAEEKWHTISLEKWSSVLKISIVELHSIFHFLTNLGIIEFMPNGNYKDTIKVNKTEFRHPIVDFLLRNYPGIHLYSTAINIPFVLRNIGMSAQKWSEDVNYLAKNRVIYFEPAGAIPKYKMIVAREDKIIHKAIKEKSKFLNTRKLELWNSFKRIINSTNCRSKEILHYFGESVDDCGKCDNCQLQIINSNKKNILEDFKNKISKTDICTRLKIDTYYLDKYLLEHQKREE